MVNADVGTETSQLNENIVPPPQGQEGKSIHKSKSTIKRKLSTFTKLSIGAKTEPSFGPPTHELMVTLATPRTPHAKDTKIQKHKPNSWNKLETTIQARFLPTTSEIPRGQNHAAWPAGHRANCQDLKLVFNQTTSAGGTRPLTSIANRMVEHTGPMPADKIGSGSSARQPTDH